MTARKRKTRITEQGFEVLGGHRDSRFILKVTRELWDLPDTYLLARAVEFIDAPADWTRENSSMVRLQEDGMVIEVTNYGATGTLADVPQYPGYPTTGFPFTIGAHPDYPEELNDSLAKKQRGEIPLDRPEDPMLDISEEIVRRIRHRVDSTKTEADGEA